VSPGPGVRLYLLRHADAGDPDAWSGPDADRPLSEKGVAQAERLGRHLARADVALRQFVSSPKLRARQTAEIVAQFVGGSVALDERLAGSLTLRVVDELVRDAEARGGLVLIGHDPDFSEALTALVGGAPIGMKKGAIARVDVRSFEPGGGDLRWLLPPALVPGT